MAEMQATRENDREIVLRFRLPVIGRMDPFWFMPRETQGHLRSMAREGLLAARSVLDAAITQVESGPSATTKSAPRSARIEVS